MYYMPGAIPVFEVWGCCQRAVEKKMSAKLCRSFKRRPLSFFSLLHHFLETSLLINNYYKTIIILLYGNYFSLNKQWITWQRKYKSEITPYLQVIWRVVLAIIVRMSFCTLSLGGSREMPGKPRNKLNKWI